MREQALFHAADKDGIKFQALGRVHGHELHRVLPGLGLVVTRLQSGMGQKGRQGRQGFTAVLVDKTIGGGCVGVQALAGGGLAEFVQRQGHGIAAKALLGHKTFGGVDQFLQIFYPVFAFAVGFEVGQQAAVVQHQVDDFAQGAAFGLLAQHVQLGHKSTEVGACLAGHDADRVVQRAAAAAGGILQNLQAARTDAARRKVDHPQKAGVVVGVLQQAQIGQRVLDFGPLEEAQAAVHAVGNGGVE